MMWIKILLFTNNTITLDTYLTSSNLSSSLIAFNATKFTADDTLLSTALLLSNFPLSLSLEIDWVVDDAVVVVIVAAPVAFVVGIDAAEFKFKCTALFSLSFGIDVGAAGGEPPIEFDVLFTSDDVISVFTPFTVL